MKARGANTPLLGRVRLWWYPVALVPLLAVGWLALTGAVPGMALPFVLFLLVFWLFSFVSALISLRRKPKEPRQ